MMKMWCEQSLVCLADFRLSPMELIFEPAQGPQRQCATVNITRDDLLEDQEIHEIALNSTDVYVNLGIQSATQLIITNFDGVY